MILPTNKLTKWNTKIEEMYFIYIFVCFVYIHIYTQLFYFSFFVSQVSSFIFQASWSTLATACGTVRSASAVARVVQTAAAPGSRTRAAGPLEKKTSRVTSAKKRPASFKVYQSAHRLCEAADAQSSSALMLIQPHRSVPQTQEHSVYVSIVYQMTAWWRAALSLWWQHVL